MPVDPNPFSSGARDAGPAAGLMALGFLTHAPEPRDTACDAFLPGGTIGRYELLESLGEGGFGIVWLALQREPIRREVALKVIKPGLDTHDVIARFEAERRALALMDHPHIAAVLDAGTTEEGLPYFVMELVRGMTLTDYCDLHRLTLRERLALFIPVCQAVQHAHQKAVLHRDLKPSNILVTEVDGVPVPKVIDFGIAKALAPGPGDSGLPGRTRAGTIVGTPQYMSPEQAGSGLDVDTRSDVYSLGVILCELLTGQAQVPPGEGDLATALRWIGECPAARPGTLVHPVTPAVERAAARRRLPASRFARMLRGDLDWITLKALEKDRARRYGTAASLALDLRRCLEGKTVSAAAPTWRYRSGKFIRRHRVPLAAAVLAVLTLIVGTGVSLWQAARAEDSRREAQANYARARKAVEVYLTKVGEHPRLQQEDFQDLKLSLLRTALPLYEDMALVEGDDPELRADRAWAIGRMADVYRLTGSPRKSQETYQECIAIEEGLVKRFPENDIWRHSLAGRYNNLCVLLGDLKKYRESLAMADKALVLLETLSAKDPGNEEYARNSAALILNRGGMLRRLGEAPEAEACLREAAGRYSRLADRFPGTGAHRKEQGSCGLVLGSLFDTLGRTEDACHEWKEAVEIFQQAIRENPANYPARSTLCACYMALGRVAFREGKTGEGDDFLHLARDVTRRLVDEVPGYPEYRENLTYVMKAIASTLSQRGMDQPAEAAYQELRVEQQRLVAAFPKVEKFPPLLAATVGKLGEYAQKRGANAEARDLYEQALAIQPDGEWRRGLCDLMLDARDFPAATRLALSVAQSPDPDWQRDEWAAKRVLRARAFALTAAASDSLVFAETCAGHALTLLRGAVSRGYTGVAELLANEKGAALLERPDFVALNGRIVLPKGIPSRFVFDYRQGEDQGIRQWRRDGLFWEETQPSGKINHYITIAPLTLDGVPGTEARTQGGGGLTLFIPDLKTPPPPMLRMQTAGKWRTLGELTEME